MASNSILQRRSVDKEDSGNLLGKLRVKKVKREKVLEEENLAGTGRVERTPCLYSELSSVLERM